MCLFVMVQSVLLSGCQSGKNDYGEKPGLISWTDTVVIDKRTPVLSLSNQTDSTIEFHLKLNELFPMTTGDMISEIKRIAATDSITEAMAAWKFTSTQTYHLPDYSDMPWINNPSVVLNSLGGALCGCRSQVLASLWHKLGYESRVVSLTGHAVAEVKEQDLWRLYDVDRGIYYTDTANQIVSVDYMAMHACDGLNVIGSDSINKLLSTCGWTDADLHMMQYSSTEDNTVSSQVYSAIETMDDRLFRLPTGSTLLFVEGKEDQPPMAVVKLTTASKGELRIPLVPYNWKGKGVFEVDDNKTTVVSDTTITLPKHKHIKTIQVLSVEDSAYVYYRLNPKVFELRDTNTINIRGYAGALRIEQAATVPLIYDSLVGVSIRFADLRYNHLDFLAALIANPPKKVDKKTAKKLYIQFLELDNGIDDTERKQMLNRYDTDFQLIWDTLGLPNERLGWELMSIRMPLALFVSFLTIRYHYHDYMYYLVNSDPDVPAQYKDN